MAWRGLLTSRRLLAACWSTPAPRVGSRVWLGTRRRPRTKSESDASVRMCRSGLGASTACGAE
eukprot:15033543-Alexandrium_andersonii.AAC.1